MDRPASVVLMQTQTLLLVPLVLQLMLAAYGGFQTKGQIDLAFTVKRFP